ncbi:hypothetical protein [Afifella sp. IM 167]|nr:hypothetical protein [Afifella sp. IM 167]
MQHFSGPTSPLDFRWPDRDWRDGRYRPAEWFSSVDRRPSIKENPHRLPS